MSALLTNKQLVRLANKASQRLNFGRSCADCIKAELGTPVAEDMTESSIGFAIEALAHLEKIQTQLRLRRQIDGKKKGGAR